MFLSFFLRSGSAPHGRKETIAHRSMIDLAAWWTFSNGTVIAISNRGSWSDQAYTGAVLI